jgi:tRNA A-37 threonylcarbamoyl transferase component Bud32
MAKGNTRRIRREFFGSASIQQQLHAVGLDSFEALWTQDAAWVEEPNFRRQGWSGVCRIELNNAAAPPIGIYLKRQENHGYRSLANPFRYQPTAYREYKRLVAMQAAGITAPVILYYGERHSGKNVQAILMTREIPPSIPLDDYLSLTQERDPAEVDQVIQDTAALIAKLHRHHFQHCALYGKHVLISGVESAAGVGSRLVPYLIDVEKSRWRLSRMAIAVRDLNQFQRRAPWTTTQWDTFLAHYMAACRMERFKPVLSWLIRKKAASKQARHQPQEKI